MERLKNFLKKAIKSKKAIAIFFAVILLLAIGSILILKQPLKLRDKHFYSLSDLAPKYAQAFSLVEGKISQSANIAINLPEGKNKEEAKAAISFEPKIKGDWVDSSEKDKLLFKPKEKLQLGKYYTIVLNSNDGKIGGDFLVEEDPKIISVFPKENSETHEKESITIIFNRPMVPLSTLDVMTEKNIPVEITPATKGKFKWIGTRTLQFIPESTLIPSASYKVKIKPDFSSLDGVKAGGFEYSFTTRNLRYEYFSESPLAYSQPIIIKFNQPIDLEKTKAEIWIKNTNSDKRIEFIAEYGKKDVYNEKTKKYNEEIDKSSILVYSKADRYGREKFWDFKTGYYFFLGKAYPEAGDIVLNQKFERAYQVEDVIKNISAVSERTDYSEPMFFDPAGDLVVQFFEEIDLGKSEIKSDKLTNIKYGEKCQDGDSYYQEGGECEKIIDKEKVIISFDKNKIGFDEKIIIKFNRIFNIAGQEINREPLEREIKSIPRLKIFRSDPSNGSQDANVNSIIICSNSPLSTPAKEDINSYLKGNLSLGNDVSWGKAYKVTWNDDKCNFGEFQTRIGYKLIPESDYKLDFKFIDDFWTEENFSVNFRTAKMPEFLLNFFHFQKKYNMTVPEKTKFTYAVENMDFVDMNICKLKAEDMLRHLEEGIDYWLGPEAINNCLSSENHRINLEKKFWVKNYFQVELKDYIKDFSGHYILTFSNPDYKEWYGDNRKVYERTYLTITNLGITKKEINIGEIESEEQKNSINNFYWVTDLKNLSGVGGAKIETFSFDYLNNNNILKKDAEFYSDSSGVASFRATSSLIGAIISKGTDSAIISNSNNKLESGSTAHDYRKIYAYTDRPIYRPGQEVFVKGLYRVGYDGNYEIFKGEKVNLIIKNSAGDEISNENLEISDFGTFNTSLKLDPASPLGTYYMYIDDGRGYASFEVEEYVPSAFRLDSNLDKEEYIAGEDFNLNISANYYFGAPVDGGEIEYSIASQNYYFDKYQDEYFNFGSSWYYCYWDCEYGDKFILRNKINLEKDGTAKISHKLDFDKLFKSEDKRESKIFVVYYTIKNNNGQSVSGQKSFIVHNGEFYLGLKTDKYFAGKEEKFEIKAKSVDMMGKEFEVKNINLSINEIEWVSSKRKEVDGGYYYAWEEKLSPIETKIINTDSNGNWNEKFSIDKEGEFKIVIEARDSKGNKIKTSQDIYVYGEAYVDIMPSNDDSLEIIADKKNLKAGEEGEIIIKSPYKKAKALISLERGKIFKYEVIDINQSLFNYRFSVKEDYAPNVYVSVTLISDKPEIKHGNVNFQIDNEVHELDIKVKSDKTYYLPGEEVSLDLTVKNYKGEPEEAEVSVAVADLSVLALKGNPKKNPLVFFYHGFPLVVSTASNIKNILYEIDVPTGTKGGGGSESEDLASKKRGEFKDTAFWQANVRTDKNGRAKIKFTLPDNLTTWQVESIGVTRNTKLGVDYQEFMAKKELMATPLKPRFIIPGDEFSIGAKIFNQSEDDLTVKISALDATLEMIDKEPIKVKINKGETATVYFRAKAPINVLDGEHKFIILAESGKLRDEVEQTIKIKRNETYETTATAGSSKEASLNEYVFLPQGVVSDRGGVEIKTSATLAVFLSDGLNYLLSYPYGCAEQIASKLESIAILKRGLNLENIGDKFKLNDLEIDGKKYTIDELAEIGLQKIYANQQLDGGFSYYPNSYQSDFYLSLHIAKTLKSMEDAGYQIDKEKMKKLFNYIKKGEINNYFVKDEDFYILTAYTLSLLKDYGEMGGYISGRVKAIENNSRYLNENISNLSLSYLAMLLADNPKVFNKKFKDKVYKQLENRIEIDSRGAFLRPNNNFIWNFYETPVKDTSLLLKALVINKEDNAVLDRIMRWLLRSRAKDGSWGSTNNTVSAIDAMTDYLVASQENKSDIDLKIYLNKDEKASFSYGPENILNQDALSLSIGEFGFGKLNIVNFSKTDSGKNQGNFYYDMSLKYFLPIDSIAPRDEGFTIEREFYKIEDEDFKNPLRSAEVGDVLKGHIKIIVPKNRNFVAIEDFIPAGMELVNFNLSTENISATQGEKGSGDWQEGALERESGYLDYYYWQEGRKINPDKQEMYDDRMFVFKQNLPEGEYEFDYYVRALVPGKFHHLPAIASEMYFPENFGRTKGSWFVINEAK